MVFYKVLDSEGHSCNGGSIKWSLPTRNEDGSWTPGEWMPEIEGPLIECENGYHLATLEQLPRWLNERIFVAETDGEIIESSDGEKWIARKVRLVAETAWNERTARLFAADCAERVLYLYERKYPDDPRPRMAIETGRKFANGEATLEELNAARDSAWAAARAAARDSAWDSAWAAARAAAADAGYAAADARAAEHKWQIAQLKEYLEVR